MNDPHASLRPQRREHPEPHESRHPIPVLVIALVAAMLGWAVGYLMAAQPGTDPALGDLRRASEFVADDATTPVAVDGSALYAAHCAACHQATGAGLPQVFPPLAGSEWVRGDEAVLLQILLHGVVGPIEVAGQTYQGAMPAFGDKLVDAELAAIATHLRGAWGNAAPAVKTEAVQRERAATATRSAPWSGGAELKAFRAPN
jgi:mono/diheme cytochrome c family protein